MKGNELLRIVLTVLTVSLALGVFAYYVRTSHTLAIRVQTTNGDPVANTEILINTKPVGTTDKQGTLVVELPMDQQEHQIEIVAKQNSLESLFLPVRRTTMLPSVQNIFAEDSTEVALIMQKVFTHDTTLPLVPTPLPNATDDWFFEAENQDSKTIVESDLSEMNKKIVASPTPQISLVRPTTAPLVAATPTIAPVKVALDVPVANETEAKSTSVTSSLPPALPRLDPAEATEFTIQMRGKALPDAQVWLGRAGTRSLFSIGKTDDNGVVRAQLPKALLGEIVFVRHPCCMPEKRPLALGGGNKLTIALTERAGVDFFVLNYAYGFARGIDAIELQSKGAKLDVGNQLGLIFAQASAFGNDFTLRSRETIPTEIKGNLEAISRTPEKPLVYYFGAKRAPIPAIGLIESDFSEKISPEQKDFWRRLRREFIARLIQARSIKPIIPAEVSRLAASVGIGTADMLHSGWRNTALNAEFDYLLSIENQGKNAAIRLADRDGVTILSEEIPLQGLLPEMVAGNTWKRASAKIPFEGTVLTTDNKGIVTINFGSSSQRQIEIGQPVLILSSTENNHAMPPTQKIASGKIIEVRPDESVVQIEPRLAGAQAIEAGMRVVRSAP